MKQKGFTLIELLAVICILSVVMLLASGTFLGVRNSIEKRNLENNTNLIKIASQKYYDQTGENIFLVKTLLSEGYLKSNQGNDFVINNEDYGCYTVNFYESYSESLDKYEEQIFLTNPNNDCSITSSGPELKKISGGVKLSLNGKFNGQSPKYGSITTSLGNICSFTTNDISCYITKSESYPVLVEAVIVYDNGLVLRKKLTI